MDFLSVAKKVIQIEINGLQEIENNLNDSFNIAVDKILNTHGRTIVCGMGKSGIIGKKIVASFASTGTPSYFMHPGEAFHGDLGMVQPADVFIAISNSGETDEILKLLPFLRDNGNYVISITGKPLSTLANNSHCHLDVSVSQEACPYQLAPTSSTTATLVMGDALTVALMEARQFRPENFARFHPGGSLGRRLLGKVKDAMIIEPLPIVSMDTPVSEIINVISAGKLGLTLVYSNNKVEGIITDGDLRRSIEKHKKNIFDLQAKDICSLNPLTISPDMSIQKAYQYMDDKAISALIVINGSKPAGILKK